MSVYVDDPIFPYGRMKMCHMVADTREELTAMVDKIGVGVWHIQKLDEPGEHYDICKSKRALAIKHGAIPVDSSAIVAIIKNKRAALCSRVSDGDRE